MSQSKRQSRKHVLGKFAFLSPAMIVIAIGFFVPLIMLFAISCYKSMSGGGLIDTSTFTLDNFKRMFDPYYLEVLWRTFRIAIYATVLSLAMGYPLAVAMSRGSNKVKNILFALILTPLLTNVTARTLGLMIIFANNGPINTIIEALGFAKFKFVGSELGIVLGLTQVFMPYMVLSIKSVLENVNHNLQEAARDLGCSKFASFCKIILPLSMPGVVAGSIFVFMLSFSSYVTPQLMGGGTQMTMTMLIYQQAITLLDWPFAAAAAIILLVFSLILLTLYNKMTSRIEKMNDRSGAFREINFSAGFHGFVKRMKDGLYDAYASIWRQLRPKKEKKITVYSLKANRVKTFFSTVLGKLILFFVAMFIILPLPIVLISAFSADKMLISFPPSGLSLRWFQSLFEKTEYIKAFFLSLRIAVISTGISLVLGTFSALGLSRFKFKNVDFVKTIFLSPLSLPAVIVGIAILRFCIQFGIVGTDMSIMLAHIVICTTYVIRTVLSSLVGFDMSLEEAARDLGASPWYTFRKVTFPIIKPGIIVSGLFSFIVSMDETTITRFIARARNMTLPVRIFAQLEYGLDLTITAISALLIVFALLILFLIDKTIGLNKFKM